MLISAINGQHVDSKSATHTEETPNTSARQNTPKLFVLKRNHRSHSGLSFTNRNIQRESTNVKSDARIRTFRENLVFEQMWKIQLISELNMQMFHNKQQVLPAEPTTEQLQKQSVFDSLSQVYKNTSKPAWTSV